MILSNETWRNLAAIMAKAEVDDMFGDNPQARGVQAGVVAALLAILPPDEFREVMAGWEIGQIRLAELLEIAGVTDKTTTIET